VVAMWTHGGKDSVSRKMANSKVDAQMSLRDTLGERVHFEAKGLPVRFKEKDAPALEYRDGSPFPPTPRQPQRKRQFSTYRLWRVHMKECE